MQIFLKYDLPKDAEKLLSDYIEAGKELERTQAKARAELAKATSDKKSKELTYKSQKDRLDKLRSQIEKCIVRATRPGMVVYASTGHRWRAATIEKGMTVRENQEILTVAGPTNMAVQTKVHESVVRKVKPGLRVRIIPDAFKDKVFWGAVESVGTTPDASNWMNPDLKVYLTMITVDQVPPDLKPGMSARVEIMITSLRDVIAVPVQAISTLRGQRICYVLERGAPRMRPVVTGQTNDQFIEVLEGLAEGDRVLLYPPEVIDAAETETETPSEGPQEENEMPAAKDEEAIPNTSDTVEGAIPAEVQALLDKLPSNRREKMEQDWKEASPEKRTQMLQRLKQGGRPRRDASQGGDRP